MSKPFLCTVIVLLVCMVATVKWHHNTDNSENEAILADTVFICNVLGEKMDKKDKYILGLQRVIISQYDYIVELEQALDNNIPVEIETH